MVDFQEKGAPTPKVWGANLIFGQKFPENCMKMKEFGPGGRVSLASPLDPPMTGNFKVGHLDSFRLLHLLNDAHRHARYSETLKHLAVSFIKLVRTYIWLKYIQM